MGSKPAKKQPDPPNSIDAQLESQIPIYQRPPSPIIEEAKLEEVGIRPDDNIDREADNKKQAEKQRNSKINQQIQVPPKRQSVNQQPVVKSSKPIKQTNLDDLSLEKGLGELNMNDIKELQKQLEIEDLSPINKSSTEAEKQKLDLQKIEQAELKIWKLKQKIKRTFNWSATGQVYMISVGFKYEYSFKLQKLQVVTPYNSYVNSILSWKNNAQNGVYEFKLRDVDIYNTDSGTVEQLQYNEVEFMVDYNGVFIGLKHESDFIRKLNQQKKYYNREIEKEQKERDQLLNNQLSNLERIAANKLKVKPQVKGKQNTEDIIKKTEKQLEQFWNMTFQCWYTIDEDNVEKQFYLDKECIIMEKKDEDIHNKLESFLVKKLQEPQFFSACFNSKKTIRDPLKKWGMFSDEEVLSYLGEPKYSVVQLQKKVTFPILQKFKLSYGILNNKDLTPQVVKWNQCKKTVIEHQKDLFVDIEQEKRLLTFLWQQQLDNKIKLKTENIFVEELNKFRDECDYELKEMLFQLSTIPNFPMENRPKYKEKYFQIY